MLKKIKIIIPIIAMFQNFDATVPTILKTHKNEISLICAALAAHFYPTDEMNDMIRQNCTSSARIRKTVGPEIELPPGRLITFPVYVSTTSTQFFNSNRHAVIYMIYKIGASLLTYTIVKGLLDK